MNTLRNAEITIYSEPSVELSAKGLGKLVRYIEGSLYQNPRYNEFAEKTTRMFLVSRYK